MIVNACPRDLVPQREYFLQQLRCTTWQPSYPVKINLIANTSSLRYDFPVNQPPSQPHHIDRISGR